MATKICSRGWRWRWWCSTERRCFRIMHSGTSFWAGSIPTCKLCQNLPHSPSIRISIMKGDKPLKTSVLYPSVSRTQTTTPQSRAPSRPWTQSHPSPGLSSSRKSKSFTRPSKCPRHPEIEGSHRPWSPHSRLKIWILHLRRSVRSTSYIVWCTLACCIMKCSLWCLIRRSCWITNNSN